MPTHFSIPQHKDNNSYRTGTHLVAGVFCLAIALVLMLLSSLIEVNKS